MKGAVSRHFCCEEIHTETGKGASRGALGFPNQERKIRIGLLDGLVVGLEELSVHRDPRRCRREMRVESVA